MSKVVVATTELFYENLAGITSSRVLKQVAGFLVSLATFPDMGKLAQSVTLTSRFGEDIRTLVCGSYLLVYRHTGKTVCVLALYPARLVR